MDVGALSALAGYAYLQAGGGVAGVVAALPAIQSSALGAAALVGSAGDPDGVDAEQPVEAFEAGTFGLQAAAGQGEQALEALLSPPAGYANPFATAAGLQAEVAPAYAAYQYAQAQQAGEAGAYAQYALQSARTLAQVGLANLVAPAARDAATPGRRPFTAASPLDANQDGLVSPGEELAYVLRHPGLDPMDANHDGTVSPAEELAYAFAHPALDPKDANLDCFVSAAEQLAWDLAHPTPRARTGVDLYA